MVRLFEKDLITAKRNCKSAEKRIEKLKKDIKNEKNTILTYSDFLELWSVALDILNNTTKLSQIDNIIQIIFSNFFVSKNNVEKYSLNKPFDKTKDPNGSNVFQGGR